MFTHLSAAVEVHVRLLTGVERMLWVLTNHSKDALAARERRGHCMGHSSDGHSDGCLGHPGDTRDRTVHFAAAEDGEGEVAGRNVWAQSVSCQLLKKSVPFLIVRL